MNNSGLDLRDGAIALIILIGLLNVTVRLLTHRMQKYYPERKGKSPQDILLVLGETLGGAHFKVDIVKRKRRPAEGQGEPH